MNRFFTAIMLITVLAAGVVAADFTTVLEQVAAYDFGDSRESLTGLSDILRISVNDQAQMAEYEKAMLKVLTAKKTSFASKQYLCKELSIMGTDTSVRTLAKMLRKKETSDIARYALERIPGETVDAELVKALKKSKGTSKIGVMNTIGNRGIDSAANGLKKALGDKNPAVAGAAASALGRIGTHETATILGDALTSAQGSLREDIVDAYLDNAVAFIKADEKNNAQSIYQLLFTEKESLPTRTAALTGLVRTVDDPTTFVVDVLENEDMDAGLKATAISLVHQCKRSMDVSLIADELPNLSTVAKVQLLTALRERGDVAAHDQVAAQLKNDNSDVSIAAISALSVLGNKGDVVLLAETAATSAGDIQEAAQASLALLSAPGVDNAVLAALPKVDAKTKVELVQSIGDRQMKTAVLTLLNAAKDENARVRVAALRALGQVAAADDMGALVDLLIIAESNAERREAERTVVAVATKIEPAEKRGTAIMQALPGVQDMAAKSSLLLVLGRIGVADALPILKDGLSSDDAELKRAAILSLSEWPTPEPADALLNVAKTAKEASHKVLGLRGYIQLAGLETERPKPETVAMYKTALDIAESASEKRRALSGLARVECPGALLLAGEYLSDSELQGEAEIAVMDNAWRTRNSKTPERKAVLQKVYEKTMDDEHKRDAKRLIDEYDK
jgi:HEAT repeat protein